jgi:hypothetical protein
MSPKRIFLRTTDVNTFYNAMKKKLKKGKKPTTLEILTLYTLPSFKNNFDLELFKKILNIYPRKKNFTPPKWFVEFSQIFTKRYSKYLTPSQRTEILEDPSMNLFVKDLTDAFEQKSAKKDAEWAAKLKAAEKRAE